MPTILFQNEVFSTIETEEGEIQHFFKGKPFKYASENDREDVIDDISELASYVLDFDAQFLPLNIRLSFVPPDFQIGSFSYWINFERTDDEIMMKYVFFLFHGDFPKSNLNWRKIIIRFIELAIDSGFSIDSEDYTDPYIDMWYFYFPPPLEGNLYKRCLTDFEYLSKFLNQAHSEVKAAAAFEML